MTTIKNTKTKKQRDYKLQGWDMKEMEELRKDTTALINNPTPALKRAKEKGLFLKGIAKELRVDKKDLELLLAFSMGQDSKSHKPNLKWWSFWK
jgi:hypothetical protein